MYFFEKNLILFLKQLLLDQLLRILYWYLGKNLFLVSWRSITLAKNEFLHEYFYGFWTRSRTPYLRNSSWWLLPQSYLTESFSADTFKEEGTIDIFPILSKFIEETAAFSNNLFSRDFQWLLNYTIADKQFLNISELKSHFSEIFEWSSIITKQQIKVFSKEKLFKISRQKAGRMSVKCIT